jgi:DNA-binding NarL/FixJ family response regulator
MNTAATQEEVTIVIANDHKLARESIRTMLESEPHLQLLAEAKDGQEVVQLCRLQRPDLVLMDVGMPKVNGFEATRMIKAELPTTRILMVSAYFDPFFASEVKRAGADGYVTELCTVQELVDAIRGCFEVSLNTLQVPRNDHFRRLVSKLLPCPLAPLLGSLTLSDLF